MQVQNLIHMASISPCLQPMVNELVVAMLSCARIGAVHSIVFGGYSAESLASRIEDGGCKVLVTADGVWRGPKVRQ